MTAPMIWGLVLLALLLLLFVRLWVLAEYEAEGFFLRIGFGIFYFDVIPSGKKTKAPRKTKPAMQKKKKEKPPKAPTESTASLEDFLEWFWDGLALLQKAGSRFRKGLVIRKLALYLTWGLDDPADAAISFGYANGVLHTLCHLLEVNLKVKDKDLRVELDYTLEKPRISAKADCSIRLYHLLSLGLTAGVGGLKLYRKVKKTQKVAKKAVQ